MGKILKIILIIIGILVVIILLDTVQALVFNNNPIIGAQTKCRTKEGIFVETYHCGKGKNITKLKKSTCYFEDVCGVNLENDSNKQLKMEIKENLNKITEVSNLSSSNPYDYTKNEYYNNIINLGKDAVLVLKGMYDKDELSSLEAYITALAIQDITACNLHDKYNLDWSTADEFYKLWENNNCGFN